jgi:hypothetical protein
VLNGSHNFALLIIISTTQTPCKLEECFLLGYKNSVRTAQETHYVSATKLSVLVLGKIIGFHGGDYEEYKNIVFWDATPCGHCKN